MERFQREHGGELDALLKDQMRLLFSDIIKKRTPPPGNSLAVGKRRVETDLRKLFEPVKKLKMLQNLDAAGKRMGFEKYFQADADVSTLRSIHQAARGADGRVKGSSNRGTFEMGSSKGKFNHPFPRKLHVHQKVFKQYLKSVQGHVGKLKGGWLAAVEFFKGVAPSKVSRFWLGLGTAGGIMRKVGYGYYWGINNVPYASTNRFLRESLPWAIETRRRDVARWYKIRLDGLTKRYNGKKSAVA